MEVADRPASIAVPALSHLDERHKAATHVLVDAVMLAANLIGSVLSQRLEDDHHVDVGLGQVAGNGAASPRADDERLRPF